MKAANPASRSVAVAGKDRAAVMMSGQRPDQRWYWDGKKYSSDLAANPVPVSVVAANQAVAALVAAPGLPLSLPEDCLAKAQAIPLGNGKRVGRRRALCPRRWRRQGVPRQPRVRRYDAGAGGAADR